MADVLNISCLLQTVANVYTPWFSPFLNGYAWIWLGTALNLGLSPLVSDAFN